jgi:hypothetical protein
LRQISPATISDTLLGIVRKRSNNMSDNVTPEGQHPKWEKVWLEKLSKVDDVIIEFFHETGDKVGDAFTEVKKRVRSMFEHHEVDSATRAEFEKVKSDTKLFDAKVETRIADLHQEGKIVVPPANDKSIKS